MLLQELIAKHRQNIEAIEYRVEVDTPVDDTPDDDGGDSVGSAAINSVMTVDQLPKLRSYSVMTVDQLKPIAKNMKIKGWYRMRKAELIKAIESSVPF